MTAAPNQNLKTSKHLDNSGASCNSKLQTFQNLFNYLITVANSQKFKTRGQAVALAANQNNNSEIAGLFCLQLQIKNSRQSLRIAASKRPRTSKPWQTNPKINPCHLITLEEKFQAKIWYNKWLNTCLLPSDITGQWAGLLLVTVQFSAPEIESETVRHRQVLPSSFRGGLRSVGRVAHFNGRSIRRSTSLQSFVGKIAVPLLDPFRDPKNGPARNHKQKLYIYFCRTISGAVKRTHF